MDKKKKNDEVRTYPFSYGYVANYRSFESQFEKTTRWTDKFLGISSVEIKESYMRKCKIANLTAGIIALLPFLAAIAATAIGTYLTTDENKFFLAVIITGAIAALGYFVIFLPIYALVGLCFIKSVGRNIAVSAMSGDKYDPIDMIFSESALRKHVEQWFWSEKLLEIEKDPYVITAMKADNCSLSWLRAYPIDYFKKQ